MGIDYNAQNIRRIISYSHNLEMLHMETAQLQHAIKTNISGEPVWEVYNPTHFLYVFFCFNTLYSVDWQTSLYRGHICNHGKRVPERDKFGFMLDFCLENIHFCQSYKEKFISIITNELTQKEIYDILNTIHPDSHYLGNIKTGDIVNFKEAISSLFDSEKDLSPDVVEEIVSFIYLIRNNIFHGTKTLYEMLMVAHQRKLLLYTYLILAVNQMLFSYLDYLNEEYTGKDIYYDSYSSLKRVLKDRI